MGKQVNKISKIIFFILWLISFNSYADNISDKIVLESAKFLNKPYALHPLSETILYRFDEFDCETYVDTVLALAFSDNFIEFQKNILSIRYANNFPDFYSRNHFPDADWIPNNIRKGYIQFLPMDNQTISMTIDKKTWFKNNNISNETVTLPYIPTENLPKVINQIPNGAIIFIVKPSFLLISHMGFAVWHNHILYLRAASSIYHKIIDVPLLPYINQDSKILGISVLVANGESYAEKNEK